MLNNNYNIKTLQIIDYVKKNVHIATTLITLKY